jgi:hypothetical protein
MIETNFVELIADGYLQDGSQPERLEPPKTNSTNKPRTEASKSNNILLQATVEDADRGDDGPYSFKKSQEKVLPLLFLETHQASIMLQRALMLPAKNWVLTIVMRLPTMLPAYLKIRFRMLV